MKEVLEKYPLPWVVRTSTGDVLDANDHVIFGYALTAYGDNNFSKDEDPNPMVELINFLNEHTK